jgi:hypothetical protein
MAEWVDNAIKLADMRQKALRDYPGGNIGSCVPRPDPLIESTVQIDGGVVDVWTSGDGVKQEQTHARALVSSVGQIYVAPGEIGQPISAELARQILDDNQKLELDRSLAKSVSKKGFAAHII